MGRASTSISPVLLFCATCCGSNRGFSPSWPVTAGPRPKIFEGAKSTVFFMDGRGGHPIIKPERMELLQKFMDDGVGFVNLHYAVDYPAKEGQRILDWMGGYYDAAISTNPHWDADFRSLPEHPITRGVKPFKMRDEWYYNMKFVPEMKNVTPILQAVPPDNTRGTADAKAHPGRAEIVAWAYERPNGGRGFRLHRRPLPQELGR